MAKKILVIEDDTLVRENLVTLLCEEGYTLFKAENGMDGVKLAWEHLPDLIVCDILMPKLDGYGVLSLLSKDHQTSSIPFIFLTARTDREALRAGMGMGADDFITKPFTRNELLGAIDTRLEKHTALVSQSQKRQRDLDDRIIENMPHDLMTPLSVILHFSDLLKGDYASMTLSQVGEIAGDINDFAHRLLRSIQNYIWYNELGEILEDRDRVKEALSCVLPSFSTVALEIAAEKARQMKRGDDIVLSIQDAPVNIVEQHLQWMIEELLDYVFTNSGADSKIQVHGTPAPESGQYQCSFIFTDSVLSSDRLQDIFDRRRFEMILSNRQEIKLGLLVVKRLTDLYQGDLTIQSGPDNETTITLILNLAPEQ